MAAHSGLDAAQSELAMADPCHPPSADMALAVVLVTVVSGPLVGAWQLARVALAPRI